MMKEFRFRSRIGKREYQHTVYARNIESSVPIWLTQIENLQDENFSFNKSLVRKIQQTFKANGMQITSQKGIHFLSFFIDDSPQITYIDAMSHKLPDIYGQVIFSKMKGVDRGRYFISGYRTRIHIDGIPDQTSCILIFVDHQQVFPGDKAQVEIHLLRPELLQSLEGRKTTFSLIEGEQVIAKGDIHNTNP